MEKIIELWHRLNIKSASATYNCGGDSFGDAEWTLFDTEGKEVENKELVDFLYQEMFVQLDFAEVSDGYYIGEYGDIVVEMDEDKDIEIESMLIWSKSANYEYSETKHIIKNIEGYRYPSMKELFQTKISSLSDWDEDYVDDCTISDEERDIINKFKDFVYTKANDLEFEEGWDESEIGYSVEYIKDTDMIEITYNYYVIEVVTE